MLGNKTPLSLINDVATRWNSTYLMIERFLILLKETIRITFVSLDVPRIEMLTEEEWCVAEELCNLLRPLEEATREMSAENYVPASKIISISTGLISVTQIEKLSIYELLLKIS